MSQEATTAVAMAQSTKQQNDPTKAAKASGSLRGPDQRFDRDGNATDLFAFFKSSPEFILGPMALATAVVAACKYSPSLAARLEDGRAVQYGYYDTMVYTVFAILTTFAAHGCAPPRVSIEGPPLLVASLAPCARVADRTERAPSPVPCLQGSSCTLRRSANSSSLRRRSAGPTATGCRRPRRARPR